MSRSTRRGFVLYPAKPLQSINRSAPDATGCEGVACWKTDAYRMSTPYETDVIAWANEQAALLRAGRLAEIDIVHIAEEIEDVGKSEQRELASRMSLLLAHLLKWRYQPERRGSSWQRTIKEQRRAIAARIGETPSLKVSLD